VRQSPVRVNVSVAVVLAAQIERAKERGEVPADLDAATSLELVIAPLHFRALLARQPIDDQAIAQLVDALLTGLSKANKQS
jgi:hypothetical protein